MLLLLKIAWRNIVKNRRQSFIHLTGLAIGITAFLLVSLFAAYELTYDRHNQHFDRIARITTTLKAPEGDFDFATTPYPLADAVKREYEEVETAVRLESTSATITLNGELIAEEGFYKADQTVFSVFSFDLLAGSLAGALREPNRVVLTRRVAEKYFASPDDAIGKTLTCDQHPVAIVAVVADLPGNSDLKIEALLSADFSSVTSWMQDDFPVYTFVLFNAPISLASFQQKLNLLAVKYLQAELDAADSEDYRAGFQIEALADVHFSEGKLMDTSKSSRLFSYVFLILALFILTLALLNYINLSTAGASERAREVGVRKISGAGKMQLAGQFVTESFLLIGLSWLLALVFAFFLVPYLNNLLDIQLSVRGQYPLMLALAGLFLVTTFLSALYPALILAGYNPVEVLKGNRNQRLRGVTLRRSIVVVQFAIAMVLMTGTLVVYRQVQHITAPDDAFDFKRVVSVRVPTEDVHRGPVNAFHNALQQRAEVAAVTVGNGVQGDDVALATTLAWNNGKQRHLFCNYFFIDSEFIPFFRLNLIAGRNFSDSLQTDKLEGFIVNQAFVKTMGWTDPIGQPIDGFNRKGKVVGVVSNFHYKSMHNLVEPLVMIYRTEAPWFISLKVQPGDLPAVKETWQRFFPDKVFDYEFLEEAYEAQYHKDTVTAKLFSYFSLLAIVICSLGLYGLVSLLVARRTREIGIRKVLGASVPVIVNLISRDFVSLILWATLIASPLAWYGMDKWLEGFAYRIEIRWWMFALTTLVAICVALLTVGMQAVRAAMANPVDSLRNE